MKIIFSTIILCLSLLAFSQNAILPEFEILELNNNARIGAIGEIGVVSSSFYKNIGLSQNPALIFRNQKGAGISLSHNPSPILRSRLLGDELLNLNAYYSPNNKHSFGFKFTLNHFDKYIGGDVNGLPIEIKIPDGNFYQFSYSLLLNKGLYVGVGIKYIRSTWHNMKYNSLDDPSLKAFQTVAFDMGISYTKRYRISRNSIFNIDIGGSIINLGPKVPRGPDSYKNFMPTKLRLGCLFNPELYLSDKLRLNLDIAFQLDKYLVPTPPNYFYNEDGEQEISEGYEYNISVFRALYQSFYDAPGGFAEEKQEIHRHIGGEIRLNHSDKYYIAIRTGYVDEPKYRQYTTRGIGIGVLGFTLDYRQIKVHELYSLMVSAISIGYSTQLNGNFFRF